MAELLIKPTAGAGYEAGDIVSAWNDHRIRKKHAEWFCREHAAAGRGGIGTPCSAGGLLKTWMESTHERRWEQTGSDEMRCVEIATSQVIETRSSTPDANGKRTNVSLFFARRLQHDRHRVFGSPGSYIYYSGRKSYAPAALDDVWAEITSQTGEVEADYARWGFSDDELKQSLVLAVADFDDATRDEYESPLKDGDIVVKKRKRWIDWQGLAVVTPTIRDQILDPVVKMDLREAATLPLSIVETKTL